MPGPGIVFIDLDTNFEWQCDILSTSTAVTLRVCGLQPLFRRQLVARSGSHSRIPDFFPGNTAHDFVYFGGSSIDLNTQWLVGGGGGILWLRRVGFRLGERDCVDGGELVKFTVCYFFGECQDSVSVPVMGSVVVVVKNGCGRYLRDRLSCKDLVCAVSHVNLDCWSGWSMRASGPHVLRRATVLLRIIGEIRVRLECCQSVWWHCAGSCCDLWLLGTWALDAGLNLGRQAAWRPGAIGVVSSRWLVARCLQLL